MCFMMEPCLALDASAVVTMDPGRRTTRADVITLHFTVFYWRPGPLRDGKTAVEGYNRSCCL